MNRHERRAAERRGKGNPPGDPPPDERAFQHALQMHQAGRLADAESACRQAVAVNPRHAGALHLCGLIALQGGDAQTALDLIVRALAVDDRPPVFHNNQGTALRLLGRIAEAETCFRRALALKPDYGRAWSNLGRVLAASQPPEAAACFRRALARSPDDLDSIWLLAELQHQQGALDEAAQCYEHALRLAPETAEIVEGLAGVRQAQGRGADAIALLQGALQANPASLTLCYRLASTLEGEARISEAADAYREAIRRDPRLAAGYNGLGNAFANLGRLGEAVGAYRQAFALSPDDLGARSNLIMTLHSLSDVSAADILHEAQDFARRVEPRPAPHFRNTPDGERPLRIGYVSADFRVHPVGFFLERVLSAHDRQQVEAFLYSDVRAPDALTARLRANIAWRPIAGMGDAEVASLILDDEIDILVDLAGHTGSNRLAVFGARAAPVQASWLGYFGTTGLSSMDYVIGDDIVAPPGDEDAFSEKLVRLAPPYLCWSPPETDVGVSSFPALTQGVVTFGCFNNRAKINRETIAAWAQIMACVDRSRLFLKSWSLADGPNRAGLVEAFAAHGIDRARLMFEGLSPRAEGLRAYNRVDIALDPFPFGGCTTTADTLWMGVPLVTLAGDRWSGRMSWTILASLGLEDWVAGDIPDYVEKAVSLAHDLPRLAPRRETLRTHMEASAFCDGAGFARRLEAAYRTMWRTYLARKG